MTNEAMNFVRGIAEAYQALEREPMLLDRVKDLEMRVLNDGQTIAHREERIHQLKGEVEALNAKIREVETERDDYGFRHMEAQDKTAHAITQLQDMFETLGETLAAINGDAKDQAVRISNDEWKQWEQHKADKAAEAERIRTEALEAEKHRQEEEARIRAEAEAEVQRRLAEAANPTPVLVEVTGTGTESVPSVSEPTSWGQGTTDIVPTVGQSEPHPTSPPETVSKVEPSPDVSSTSATPEASAVSQDLPQRQGKYSGKKYADWPYYVSLSTWLSEGGTEEDYLWKRGATA